MFLLAEIGRVEGIFQAQKRLNFIFLTYYFVNFIQCYFNGFQQMLFWSCIYLEYLFHITSKSINCHKKELIVNRKWNVQILAFFSNDFHLLLEFLQYICNMPGNEGSREGQGEG